MLSSYGSFFPRDSIFSFFFPASKIRATKLILHDIFGLIIIQKVDKFWKLFSLKLFYPRETDMNWRPSIEVQ